jgi:hypothetical protein
MTAFSFPDVERTIPRYADVRSGPADRFGALWNTWKVIPIPLFPSGYGPQYATDQYGNIATDQDGNPVPIF